MAKQRSEHADVVAAPITGSEHCLLVQLVRRADARRPVRMILDAAVQRNASDARDEDVGRWDGNPSVADIRENEPALADIADGLRVDEIEPQAVVQRQLAVGMPRVLRVIEMAPLAFAGVGERAGVAPEFCHVAEQERGEPRLAPFERAAREAANGSACAVAWPAMLRRFQSSS